MAISLPWLLTSAQIGLSGPHSLPILRQAKGKETFFSIYDVTISRFSILTDLNNCQLSLANFPVKKICIRPSKCSCLPIYFGSHEYIAIFTCHRDHVYSPLLARVPCKPPEENMLFIKNMSVVIATIVINCVASDGESIKPGSRYSISY